MGRGRQKAKHTKVARELKYTVHETNYSALERELAGSNLEHHTEDEFSKWAEYYDEADDTEGDDDGFDAGMQQRRA